MKKIILGILLLCSQTLWADVNCQGSGVQITIFNSSDLRAEIRKDGTLLAETRDVSDLSAFEVHYVGNFKRSSFDLRVKDNGIGKVSFDNFIYSFVKLNCTFH